MKPWSGLGGAGETPAPRKSAFRYTVGVSCSAQIDCPEKMLMKERPHAVGQLVNQRIRRHWAWRAGRRVRDGVKLAAAKIQLFGLCAVERARAASSEHGELISTFINAAVAVDPT
jgi:hypothetical protein